MQRLASSRLWIALAIISALLVCVLILAIWVPWTTTIRAFVGLSITFILPGLVWSFSVWPKGTVDTVERGVFSVLTSIVGVTVLTYFFHRAGGAITTLNIFLLTATLIASGILFHLWLRFRRRRAH